MVGSILKKLRLQLMDVTTHPNFLTDLSKKEMEEFVRSEKRNIINQSNAAAFESQFKKMEFFEQAVDFQLEKTCIQMEGLEWNLLSGMQVKPNDILQITASVDEMSDASICGNSLWDFFVSFRFSSGLSKNNIKPESFSR